MCIACGYRDYFFDLVRINRSVQNGVFIQLRWAATNRNSGRLFNRLAENIKGHYMRALLLTVLMLTFPLNSQADMPMTAIPKNELSAAIAAWEKEDYKKAFAILKKHAEAGDPFAQLTLSGMYENGLGVKQNKLEADRLLRKAAEQGHPIAQTVLGRKYYDGHGVTKNISEAMRLWKSAAEQNYAPAQYGLAVEYYEGKAVPKNNFLAFYWAYISTHYGQNWNNEEQRKSALVIEESASKELTPFDVLSAVAGANQWREKRKLPNRKPPK